MADVNYPFIRCRVEVWDGEGATEIDSWKPGVRFEPLGPYGEESEAVADGVGMAHFEEVSRHKPGKKYPERVFYVRTWTDPDGNRFGKTHLRITTAQAFARRCNGYWHEYRVDDAPKATP